MTKAKVKDTNQEQEEQISNDENFTETKVKEEDIEIKAKEVDCENNIEQNEETIIEQASKEQEYLLLAQKTQAEFENYRKRTIKAESEARLNGIVEAVSKFLPVLDSFDMAIKQETNEEYVKANSMILNQLNKALEDLGVKKIDALNQQFDYNLHNAIMVDNNEEAENNQILQVFQEGYILKDKVIRHSIVKVNKK